MITLSPPPSRWEGGERLHFFYLPNGDWCNDGKELLGSRSLGSNGGRINHRLRPQQYWSRSDLYPR
ncbi:hypothetical protein CCP3SC1_930005 [Gammaproteobacteria bacterium]